MLMGEYTHTIDTKGRVILPATFRSEIGKSFIITKGLDRCLFIYGMEEWDKLANKLHQLPLSKPEARALVRFFFSGARTLECDRQGRILVPSNLRAYAELRKEVVLLGVPSRIEVWSKENWTQYNDDFDPATTEIAASLAGFGI